MSVKRSILVSILMVMGLLLIAGRTSVVGQPRWMYWTRMFDSAALDGTTDHIAPCITQVGQFEDAVSGTAAARHACYPDPERDFQLTRFGLTVIQPLDTDAEECEFVLEADDDGTAVTGDEINSSRIQVGDGATGSNPNTGGVCGNSTLVAIGDSCILDLDTSDAITLVSAGGWFTINSNDGDSGQTCTTSKSVQFHVWGYYP